MALVPDKNNKPREKSKPKKESKPKDNRITLPFLTSIEKWSGEVEGKAGIRITQWPIFILGCALLAMAFLFMPNIVAFALSMALFLAPLWLPILLLGSIWPLWVAWRRSEFIATQKFIVLEIKPPRTIIKTPLAMEAVLAGMFLTGGEATWYKKYVLGSIRPSWSLEIASLEGRVHFYIWMREGLRRLFEAHMYAQYPGVHIVEAPDYTRLISGTNEEWGIWGCDYKKTSEKDSLPIKTYVEYGLDKVQKEPEQVDPFANLIEFMSSIGKDEYLWVQFIFRAHKGEKYRKKNKAGKPYTWKDEAEETIQEIRDKTRDTYTDPATGESRPGFPNPTRGQMDRMAAIERNVSKQAFDVGGRSIYFAQPHSFVGSTISGMIGLFKQFSSEGWNGVAPTAWMMQFDDYPWEIGVDRLKNKVRCGLVEAYRRRQFFYPPFSPFGTPEKKVMVMSTEELATVFHIPSRAIETPGLERIQSATSEAPANLPT